MSGPTFLQRVAMVLDPGYMPGAIRAAAEAQRAAAAVRELADLAARLAERTAQAEALVAELERRVPATVRAARAHLALTGVLPPTSPPPMPLPSAPVKRGG